MPVTGVEIGRGAGGGSVARRAETVEPFLRGVAWAAGAGAPYPRADPADVDRLPRDTWGAASIPVGVRLELAGDATALRVRYVATTAEMGFRGPSAGTTFSVWRSGEKVDERPAELGEGEVELSLGAGDDRAVVYLPEGMKPVVTALAGIGGQIAPAPRQPRWLCYGDSIAEGWVASEPALAWPAITGRRWGLDVVNLGYAGAARGEIVCAEQLAALDAQVVSVTHGTNCWTRVPHSASMMRATTEAFLRIVRAGHPGVPIVLGSPVVRPDAESTPNKLGATLADLRAAMEEVGRALVEEGDELLTVVPGAGLIAPSMLADGVHPGDEGHEALARSLGEAVARAVSA